MEKKLYVIDEKAYLRHINDEVHLYGLLHQLAFLAGKVKDAEDMAHLIDTVKRYGEIADEKFDDWDIPGRYMVFGDKADLTELYKKELAGLDVFDLGGEPEPDEDDGDDTEDLGSGLAAFFDVLADMADKARSIADTLDDFLDVGGDE